jgi:hypothetical protein
MGPLLRVKGKEVYYRQEGALTVYGGRRLPLVVAALCARLTYYAAWQRGRLGTPSQREDGMPTGTRPGAPRFVGMCQDLVVAGAVPYPAAGGPFLSPLGQR